MHGNVTIWWCGFHYLPSFCTFLSSIPVWERLWLSQFGNTVSWCGSSEWDHALKAYRSKCWSSEPLKSTTNYLNSLFLNNLLINPVHGMLFCTPILQSRDNIVSLINNVLELVFQVSKWLDFGQDLFNRLRIASKYI